MKKGNVIVKIPESLRKILNEKLWTEVNTCPLPGEISKVTFKKDHCAKVVWLNLDGKVLKEV